MSSIEYEFKLLGPLRAKKNRYTPRRDKRGFFKSSKLQEQIDRIAIQIPGELRDLKLESPDMEVWFYSPSRRFDRDGSLTTLLDILKQYGVIVDDNVAHFNGTVVLHPCLFAEFDYTIIKMVDRSNRLFAKAR